MTTMSTAGLPQSALALFSFVSDAPTVSMAALGTIPREAMEHLTRNPCSLGPGEINSSIAPTVGDVSIDPS